MTREALTWIPLPPFAHFHSASQTGETAAVRRGPLGSHIPRPRRYLQERWPLKELLQTDESGLNAFLNFAKGQYLQKKFSMQ